MKQKNYQINDLNYGVYSYDYYIQWFDECGDNHVSVYGERSGIIEIENGEYYDIVADCIIPKENIKSIKPLKDMVKNLSFELNDTALPIEQIIQLAKKIDEAKKYQSYEITNGGGYGDTTAIGYIPSSKTYDSTEEKQGILKREFNKSYHREYSNEYCKPETNNRVLKKIKSIIPKFKRH